MGVKPKAKQGEQRQQGEGRGTGGGFSAVTDLPWSLRTGHGAHTEDKAGSAHPVTRQAHGHDTKHMTNMTGTYR